jgi:two-component system response regulator HydG
MARILVVEDDLSFSMLLESFLKKHGHEVLIKHTVKESIPALAAFSPDLLILDYRLPDGTGMDVLAQAHTYNAKLPVIIMTSFNDIRTAVKAIRSGAYDYITKPVNPEELLMVMKDALARQQAGDTAPVQEDPVNFVTGTSENAQQLHQYVQLVAPTDMSVIIQGESGTGKENIARTIHRLSKRSKAPFVAIDCGALTPELAASELFGHVKGAFTGAVQDKQGQFEAADGGTLFLDEVGNLSYEIQVKLLRAIQERVIQPIGSNRQVHVDVRIITATNDDLLLSVRNGAFREDLYHRLNEFKIKVPPLRERAEDLLLFIDHFVKMANKELGRAVTTLSPEVRELFMQYEWPGNLRELKNIIKRATLLATRNVITMEALPDEMVLAVKQGIHTAPTSDLKILQADNEREMIIKTLQQVKYNKSKAARLLNIDRKTLYYKMSKYHIDE